MSVFDMLFGSDDEVTGHQFDKSDVEQLTGMYNVVSGFTKNWDEIQNDPELLAAAMYMAEHSEKVGYAAIWEDSDGDKFRPSTVEVQAARELQDGFENGNLTPPSGP